MHVGKTVVESKMVWRATVAAPPIGYKAQPEAVMPLGGPCTSARPLWFLTWFSCGVKSKVAKAARGLPVSRILQVDSVAQKDGQKKAKNAHFPKFYNYNPGFNCRNAT